MEEKIIPLTRFKGEANAGLSIQDMMGKGFLERAVNVDITDSGGITTRNGYKKLLSASDVAHSIWASNEMILFRDGTDLKKYNIDLQTATTLYSGFIIQILPVCYRNIAGSVYLMDGVTAGKVDGLVYSTWSVPIIGKIFDNYISRMWVVFGNYIFYSRPWDYDNFDQREYLSFESPITMIEAVRTGIWVGTVDNVYFLSGTEPPLQKTHILDRGVIPGTSIKIAGAVLSPDIHNEVVIWTTNSGIFLGGDEGFVNLINLTPNFKPPRASLGKAGLKREKGMVQYVVFLEDSVSNNEGAYGIKSEVNVVLPSLRKL